jgi:hypothetical protein
MLTSLNLLFILSGLALISGVMGLCMGIYSMISVKAMEKATHTVTYMPVDKEIDKMNEEFLATQKDEWGTSESEIEKQNKYWANDLEKEMPDFAPNDDDKKRIVF